MDQWWVIPVIILGGGFLAYGAMVGFLWILVKVPIDVLASSNEPSKPHVANNAKES